MSAHLQIDKQNIAYTELEVIDKCGHFPMYEKFEEYITRLQEFLK